MEQLLQGKIALVTGAAGDIGREVCRQLLGAGAGIAICDRDEDALSQLQRELSSKGAPVLCVAADVSEESAVMEVMRRISTDLGGLDILFNNAGIEGVGGDITELSVESFDQVMAVNVRGVFLGIKHAVPLMRARGGGSIINTASVAGLSGASEFAPYSASKHAVVGLTRSTAQQLGPDNIRVNAVCPSPVTGRMMASIEGQIDADNPAAVHEQLVAAVPLLRFAEPEDVANLVLFLCSPPSAFITGATYTVDGGVTA